MKQTRDVRTFFRYVIPSVLSFALSGVYAIGDGFFVDIGADGNQHKGRSGKDAKKRQYKEHVYDMASGFFGMKVHVIDLPAFCLKW